MKAEAAVPGVYASLDDLVRLQFRAKGFSFKSRQPVHSLLSGRHGSRMRGRGLDFEEIRAYVPGDDIRTIDWHVTARTGAPHTRVYTEERDRPAMLVVDQRLSMFYGTRKNLKSVTAAETAALAAWRVFATGDRVGAVIFDDQECVDLRPHRSRGQVVRILEAVVAKNRALRADSPTPPGPGLLNQALERVRLFTPHDFVVAIISDFDGADGETSRLVTGLAQHNDVICALVVDPSHQDLPEHGRAVVSGGDLQIQLDVGRSGQRDSLLALARGRVQSILAWSRELRVPVMPLSTAEDVAEQVRRRLGAAPRARRA